MAQRRLLAAAATTTLLAAAAARAATPATIDVDVGKPGPAIPLNFYGLITEEINHSHDGGLFAELVQNRTFQDDAQRSAHWSVAAGSGDGAKIAMVYGDPVNGALPVSLRLDLGTAGHGSAANDGYWGVPVRPDTTYTASFYAKGGHGFAGPVTAAVVLDEGSATVARADTSAVTGELKKYTVTLKTGHDVAITAKAKFVLSATGSGTVTFSLASLFPPTYMDTPGGLRPDLMKLMADLHPSFIRLPGGNYLEGDTFPMRFRWKQQIGPADTRPGHMGCWSYRSSDGFGLPQYLLWCKQLHAEPILAVFAGYTLNHDLVHAGPDLQPYVDEALEEIEYVTGPADSEWGRRRATDGFPEPFHVTYLEVGNEDWFDNSGGYDGRFTQFYDAIHAKHPELKLIATAPVTSRKPDLVDDHYYRSPRQMAFDWDHYHKPADGAPGFAEGHTAAATADGPKVFCGEWASQEGRPTPDLNAALGDAAWLMGLERDSDRVPIECYAPLLVNVNPGAWQWPTNLIGYDALASFGSPSYHAQAMFGQNKGDAVLPTELTLGDAGGPKEPSPHGAVGVGTWHTNAEFRDVVVTAPDGKPLLATDPISDPAAWRFTGDKWTFNQNVILPGVADAETWAVTGDANWTDYTVHLKARKTAGKEGFLILYHVADAERYGWWNLGGWSNTRTGFEATEGGSRQAFGPESAFKVQAGRWYDLRLEVRGHHVRGYVDGKLVSDATERAVPNRPAVFASGSYASASHDVILKVVNMTADPVAATVNFRGAGQVTAAGRAIVLQGDPRDVNTITEPTKVAPKEEPLTDAAATFKRTFPPHSLTLLRVAATAR